MPDDRTEMLEQMLRVLIDVEPKTVCSWNYQTSECLWCSLGDENSRLQYIDYSNPYMHDEDCAWRVATMLLSEAPFIDPYAVDWELLPDWAVMHAYDADGHGLCASEEMFIGWDEDPYRSDEVDGRVWATYGMMLASPLPHITMPALAQAWQGKSLCYSWEYSLRKRPQSG